MKPGFLTLAASLLLFVALIGAAAFLQHDRIKVWQNTPSVYRDSLYVPDSRYVQAMAMGYDMSVSDFLWLRMIQAYAGGWSKKENAEMMEQYFDVVTDLDPTFYDVYSFTIMAVGEDGKRPDLAQRVVRKGMIEMPGDHRVPVEGASYASLNMSDNSLAKFYTRMALLDPNHPEYIDRWLPHFEAAQGRYQLAYEKFMADMLQKVSEGNTEIALIVHRHLKRAVDDWIRSEIRTHAVAWHEAHGDGSWPTVEMLDQEGALKGMLLPDWRMVDSILNAMIEGPSSRNTLDPTVVDQIVQSTIKTWDKLPAGPYDFINPNFSGYVIWPNGEAKEDNQEDKLVLSRFAAAQLSQGLANVISARIEKFKQENGRCPGSLQELDPEALNHPPPLGGQFVIDPQNCIPVLPPYGDLLAESFPD